MAENENDQENVELLVRNHSATEMEKRKRLRGSIETASISALVTFYFLGCTSSARKHSRCLLLLGVSVILLVFCINYYSNPPIMRSRDMLKQTYHWCLEGGQDNYCNCPNPLHPLPPRHDSSTKNYFQVHQENVQVATNQKATIKDIVFFGDSITERWLGKKRGHEGNKAVFDRFFNKTMKGEFDGLALGISGDEVSTFSH